MSSDTPDHGTAFSLYSSTGETLTRYSVDVDRADLTRQEAVKLPGNVQYLWPHPSRRTVYVVSSDGGSASAGVPGTVHRLCALTVDPATGALRMHGAPQPLPSRPIHVCVDATGRYALTAYNNPSNVTVHRINADGTVGAPVAPSEKLDTGIFAHQVLVTPSNRAAVLVTRGNDATGGKPEDPGAFKFYRMTDGVLANLASIAPGGRGGLGFGPRHIDFHPEKPWLYASIERQNKLHMYRLQGDAVAPEPDWVRDTLAHPGKTVGRQLAGAIHVHAKGHVVYVSNRADNTEEFEGRRVFRGGENSIAVFSIDPATGEPTLIQHADPRSFHVRTFALDPSGRLLVAANTIPMLVRDGTGVRHVPAGLAVFRVAADGTLDFVRKVDVETPGKKTQFWMGLVRR